VRESSASHPDGRLPVQRLRVERALTGDDQPRAVQLRTEREHLQQHLDAWPHPRAEEQLGGETEAARRAGARRVASGRTARRLRDVRPRGQARFEQRHVAGRGTFLRSVDRRRA